MVSLPELGSIVVQDIVVSFREAYYTLCECWVRHENS